MTDAVHGDERRDVVIVGAGVAGVSCAIECVDIQLDTAVFETHGRPGGQLVEIPHAVRNVATGPPRTGSSLRDSLEDSAVILGDRLRLSHPVTGANLGERWIEVDRTRIRARALVIATGTSHQQLPAAPDGAFGGDVTYLLEARPDQFAGRDVVVIGGGDSGTLDALELARAGSTVTLVHRSEALTARDDIVEQVRREPRIEELAGWELASLDGGDRLEAVSLVRPADGQRRRVEAGGLVVKIARRATHRSLSGSTGARPSGCDRRRRPTCRRRAPACSPRATWSRVRTHASQPRWARARLPPDRSFGTSRADRDDHAVDERAVRRRRRRRAPAAPRRNPRRQHGTASSSCCSASTTTTSCQWEREDAARDEDADDHAVAARQARHRRAEHQATRFRRGHRRRARGDASLSRRRRRRPRRVRGWCSTVCRCS